MQENFKQPPLWRQLQGASSLLMAVRGGQSMTAALENVDTALRPGVQALAFHALRWMGRAEALRQQLAKKPPPPEADALLCVVLALIWREADSPYTPHTLVDQAVEAAKHSDATKHQASFINGCLRRFLRERDELVARTEKSPQAVWNHPQWWIDRVRKDHPDQWQGILNANNVQAPLALRINRRRTSPDQYIRALAAMDIEAKKVGPDAVVLMQARQVTLLPGFDQGHFSVQDVAAQMAAPLLLDGLVPEAGKPLRVLDACAAPGGKTSHLLELMDCEVTALDIDARRCERIGQNLARLGLQARIEAADAGSPAEWWDGRPYDAILLDAPCTASGIVRRHPDVRWLRRPGDIDQLAAIQLRLLETLWPLVRVGGRLLYCTCSVFRSEGSKQVETFVARHTEALLKPSPGHLLPQNATGDAVFPDNLTSEHDGFYYALLEKRNV